LAVKAGKRLNEDEFITCMAHAARP
jgi:hypothetical protein